MLHAGSGGSGGCGDADAGGVRMGNDSDGGRQRRPPSPTVPRARETVPHQSLPRPPTTTTTTTTTATATTAAETTTTTTTTTSNTAARVAELTAHVEHLLAAGYGSSVPNTVNTPGDADTHATQKNDHDGDLLSATTATTTTTDTTTTATATTTAESATTTTITSSTLPRSASACTTTSSLASSIPSSSFSSSSSAAAHNAMSSLSTSTCSSSSSSCSSSASSRLPLHSDTQAAPNTAVITCDGADDKDHDKIEPTATEPDPVDTVRGLLESVAAIGQKLPLRTSTRLSTLLARPRLLQALVSFLGDTGPIVGHVATPERVASPPSPAALAATADPRDAPSGRPVAQQSCPMPSQLSSPATRETAADLPQLAAHFLTYGSQELRHNLLASPVVLSSIMDLLLRNPLDPVVAMHVVSVLESFLDYSPLPLLEYMAAMPAFIPALISSVHIPAVASLLSSIIPARIDDTALGPSGVLSGTLSPQVACTTAMLASASLPALLANVFSRAGSQVLQNRISIHSPTPETSYQDLQRLNNAADVFASIMSRLLPVFRIPLALPDRSTSDHVNGSSAPPVDISALSLPSISETAAALPGSKPESVSRRMNTDSSSLLHEVAGLNERHRQAVSCHALNIFENHAAASALGAMLDVGISTLTASNLTCTDTFYASINCAVRLLDAVGVERAHRVVVLTGHPRPVVTSALDAVIASRFPSFIEILLDTARLPSSFALCRVRILDLVVGAQRVCSPSVIYPALDRVRYSEVAYKLMCLRPRCSLLHVTVSASVEEALLADNATRESCAHWLVRGRLVDKILSAWARDGGALNWSDPSISQTTPYLSAIIHMACCVLHLRAMDTDLVAELVGPETLAAFTAFCTGPLTLILQSETAMLGGGRPPRRRSSSVFRGGPGGGHLNSSLSAGSLSAGSQSAGSHGGSAVTAKSRYGRTKCASVPSPCAHRFGYVPPPSRITGRARAFRLGRVFHPRSSLDDFPHPRAEGVVSRNMMSSSELDIIDENRSSSEVVGESGNVSFKTSGLIDDFDSDEDGDYDDCADEDDNDVEDFGVVLSSSSTCNGFM